MDEVNLALLAVFTLALLALFPLAGYFLADREFGLKIAIWLGSRMLEPYYVVLDEEDLLLMVIRSERTQTSEFEIAKSLERGAFYLVLLVPGLYLILHGLAKYVGIHALITPLFILDGLLIVTLIVLAGRFIMLEFRRQYSPLIVTLGTYMVVENQITWWDVLGYFIWRKKFMIPVEWMYSSGDVTDQKELLWFAFPEMLAHKPVDWFRKWWKKFRTNEDVGWLFLPSYRQRASDLMPAVKMVNLVAQSINAIIKSAKRVSLVKQTSREEEALLIVQGKSEDAASLAGNEKALLMQRVLRLYPMAEAKKQGFGTKRKIDILTCRQPSFYTQEAMLKVLSSVPVQVIE